MIENILYKIFSIDSHVFNEVKISFNGDPFFTHLAGTLMFFYIVFLINDLKKSGGFFYKKSYYVLFLAFVVWLMVEILTAMPSIEFYKVKYKPKKGIVLVDNSYSMDLPVKAQSREDYVKKILINYYEKFSELNGKVPIELYRFGDNLKLLGKWDIGRLTKESWKNAIEKINGKEKRSDFSKAVKQILNYTEENKIGWFLLFSDGVFRNVELSDNIDKKFFSVPALPTLVPDISILDVYYPKIAYVRSPVILKIKVDLENMEKFNGIITVFEDGKVILTKTVLIKKGKNIYKVEIRPNFTGEHVYKVFVNYISNERIKVNNEYFFTLNVLLDKIRVLHIIGRPSWDSRFLRLYLKNDPRVDLVSFTILRSNDDYPLARDDELSLIPFPTRTLFGKELNNFDVVILQNFNYREYFVGSSFLLLDNLKNFVVNRGGGLVVIGGELSFSEGDYQVPPLTYILPVVIPFEKGSIDPNPVKLKITKEGLLNPITNLGLPADKAAEIWNKLPPVDGVNILNGLANNGRALLIDPQISYSGEKMPVLAINSVGRGRIMTIATDSFWKYAFLTGDNEELRGVYYKFWKRSIRWLINDREFKQVKIKLSDMVVFPGDEVKISVTAFYNDYLPVPEKALSLYLEMVGGGSYPLSLTGAKGLYSISLKAPSPGSYKVVLNVMENGKIVNSDNTYLLVKNPEAEEKRNIHLNIKNLPGTVSKDIPFENLKNVAYSKESKIITGMVTKKLYNNVYFLALLLLLFYLLLIGRRLVGLI